MPNKISQLSWCVAYADKTKFAAADKAWIPDNDICPNIRYNDQLINDYILLVSQEKFSPATTLRFSPLVPHLQMAIPFKLLDDMDVCGICYPKKEAEGMKAKFPRVNFKAGDFMQHNSGIIKRTTSKTVCPDSSKTSKKTS